MSSDKRNFANKAIQQQECRKLSQFYPGLLRYCRFLARNAWDGDDLAQESLLRAIHKYPASEISSALLKKIAYHFWIDTARKKKNEQIGIPYDLLQVDESSRPDELMNSIQQLLEQLTPKQAIAYFLKEAFLFRSKEIAELLGTTEMAVKATLHRAKKRLEKESLTEIWDEHEKQLLFELMYSSIQSDDPKILIETLAEISLETTSPLANSPLNSYCMAA